MSPHPKPRPDPSQAPPSFTGALGVEADAAGRGSECARLAARLSAQGGGGLPPDLAANLAAEIVLNEIAEQACLATGATGAAIVLRRNGEMACRASSGATAPEIGSPLDTSTGLSGECVRTLRTLRCDDVLVDARADVEASLRMGVRSVIVMPLLRGEELLGVFELFSSRPCAFGDRDERTLEALAGRALANLERAAQPPPPAEVSPIPDNVEIAAGGAENTAPGAESVASGAEGAAARGFDFLTLALGVAVLACAVLLGVALGRHLGVQKAKTRPYRTAPSSVPVNVYSVTGTPAATSSSGKAENAEEAARPVPSKSRTGSAVPPGGLLVYENGREIFRMSPRPGEPGTAAGSEAGGTGVQPAAALETEENDQEKAVELPPEVAVRSLIYRVEPEYPEEARQQQIQGSVMMKVRISPEGTVEDVQVVSGPPQLAQSATAAVKQWRFKPHRENGRAVRTQTLITLNFRLTQ
jgi:TonB family protein